MDTLTLAQGWIDKTLTAQFEDISMVNDLGVERSIGSGILAYCEGEWKLRIFSNFSFREGIEHMLLLDSQLVAGQWIPDNLTVSLNAYDKLGFRWKFDEVLLNMVAHLKSSSKLTNNSVSIEQAIEFANVTSTHIEHTPSQRSVSVCFLLHENTLLHHTSRKLVPSLGKLDTTSSIFIQESPSIVCGNATIHATQRTRDLWFSTSDNLDGQELAKRLAQTLTFLLARPASATAIITTGAQATCTLSHLSWRNREQCGTYTPLPNPGRVEESASFWQAVPLYTGDLLAPRYAIMIAFDTMWWQVAVARRATTWIQCVVLCACIERCAVLLNSSVDRSPTAEEANLINIVDRNEELKVLSKDVKAWVDYRRRMGSNPKVKMLLTNGILTKKHFSTWNSVRHPSAHGNIPDRVENIHLSQVSILYDALISCTLHAIGYSGKRVDYASVNWPISDFAALPEVSRRVKGVEEAESHA